MLIKGEIELDIYMEVVKNKECVGCSACQSICDKQAISMCIDKEGFWYPAISVERCIKCDKCLNVCPVHMMAESNYEEKKNHQVDIYAAWSLDHEIRYHSTSGGIFSELALKFLKNGGYVCGAVYDEKYMVKHFITNDIEDVKKLRQSKYVQSEMCEIYIEIEKLLQRNSSILFCGTPCQCTGVFNYCKVKNIRTSNLYMVDFICRGVNSPKVYKKFLGELENEYAANINRVWFKNKTFGWNRFSTKIEFDNGKSYLKDRYHDTYIRGYIEENLFIRPSCTVCRFKGFHRIADLTLADFWGVQLDKKYIQDSDGGTSMVMVHTEQGKQLWDSISANIFKIKKCIDDVTPGNICFESSVQHGVYRQEFMADLDKMPVVDNIERFLKDVGQ